MNRTRALLLICAVPLLIVIWVLATSLGGGEDRGSPPPSSRGPFVPPDADRVDVGSGARGAAIFRPRGARGPGAVVVLLHGWRSVDPSYYGAWIAHLIGDNVTVVYPTYQESPFLDVTRPLPDALAGLRAAFAGVDLAPGRLVVAGHSAGGVLAADYAVVARSAGLPSPAAVLSVYPGRTRGAAGERLALLDARAIPRQTRVIVLAGLGDAVVGEEVARQIVRAAGGGRARLGIVRDPAAYDHEAPTRGGAAERRAFWEPLDRLIAAT